MASLANQTISSTYDGLIKTSTDQPVGVSGVQLLEDGVGNTLALSVGRANQGVTVTGTLTATALSGPLTGNVTGDLTGTVLTAAQPNVTSVGTLSSLAVSGNLTVDTDTLFVDSANNRVGIGTTTTVDPLTILTGLDYSGISLSRNPSTNTAQRVGIRARGYGSSDTFGLIGGADLTGSSAEVLIGVDGSIGPNAISFRTAPTYGSTTAERVRINSSGNVGIGTTTPRSILETKGTISIFDSRTSVTTGDTLAGIEIYADDVNYNPPSGRTQMPVNRILPVVEISGGDAFGMAFYTAALDADSVERLRINSSGNVGIGTTSPAVKLDVVGQVRASTGILFGADTAAANALDDYEEGTWTTTFGTLTNVTGTPVLADARYTKIGNLVYCEGTISGLSTVASGTTTVVAFTGPFSQTASLVRAIGAARAAQAQSTVGSVIDNTGGNVTELAIIIAADLQFSGTASVTYDFSITYRSA